MSARIDKVGEMFMVGFDGTDAATASDLIQRRMVGGIILFTRNIRDASHAAEVCWKLQQMRRDVSDSPLFISIDQEGGCVARITEGVTVFPGAMALGAAGSERLARQAGGVTGAELSALGINVNFAPVLDISSNPQNPGVGARSFGSNPQLAARLGSAMIEGMQENGVLGAAKHFPGLGEAQVDSHDERPVVNATVDELERRELLPFRAAIGSEAPFIMTAHCAYPSLDETLAPATLSRPILSGLLRGRMRYRGIIITDCLEMAGIEKGFPAPQASVMAARAGATMLLICHTRQKQIAAIEALGRAVESGEIPAETIDEAGAIISSVKEKLRFLDSSPQPLEPRTSLSEDIASKAVTIVRNEDSAIPLRLDASERLAVVVPAFEALTKVEEAAGPHEVLLRELGRRHAEPLYVRIPVEPSRAELREHVETCRDADRLLILTYNMHRYATQCELVRALLRLEKPAVVAAVRDPYDLALVPEARACVATYSFRDCSMKALIAILFGEIEAGGTLPVDLELSGEQ